jgi:hypothetical protein
MTRWNDSLDDDGMDGDGRDEDPDPSDQDVDVNDDTIPCPWCRTPIYENSEFCPHCGKYVTEEEAPSSRYPVWIIVGVVLGVIASAIWMW